MATKGETIHLRVSTDEKELLKKTAEISGSTEADVLRGLIRVASQYVAVDRMTKRIGASKKIEEYLNAFAGLTPLDLARCLVLIAMAAEDKNKTDEFAAVLDAVFREPYGLLTPELLVSITTPDRKSKDGNG